VSLAWTRAILTVAGRPFARALVAPTMAWMVPAAILFGGNGISAKVAVGVLRGSLGTWLVVVGGFCALTAPAVGAALEAKGNVTLRSLRPPRGVVVASFGLLFALAQAPLFVLFARAGAWPLAFAHGALAMAVEVVFVKLAKAVVPRLPRARPRTHGATTALALHHVRALVRREQASLALSATALALGAAAMGLSCANDPPRSPLGRAMCVLAGPVCAAAALLVRPIARQEAALAALLASARAKRSAVVVAMAVVTCAPNAAYASATTYATTSHGAASAQASVFALAVALAVVAWARRHARTAKQDPAVFVAGALGIALAATLTGAAW
jgi:hypothetical protein